MATSSKVCLTGDEHPVFSLPGISRESAEKASKLLTENHEKYHIFFNRQGFHNHIAHHLLTLYALGATPEEIQLGYDRNKTYQLPPVELEPQVVESMHDPAKFKQCLGNGKYYHDFLVFFQGEIDKLGWESVVTEYVFKGDERADDMLVRLFAGFLHPVIHLGFGVEFRQPAIIAEALAQTAVHDNWIGKLLLPAEKAAKEAPPAKKRALVELLDEIRADKELATAAYWDDGNKIRDGTLARAGGKMINIAAQYTVEPEDLKWRTAEMVNSVVYYTAGAQRPPKLVKFDFYFMHCVNSSIFWPAFNGLSFLTETQKCRLLEWKGRVDLAMYASRRSPDILIDEISKYAPQNKGTNWDEVYARVRRVNDDGHACKLVRAVAHGKRISAEYESRPEFRVKGETWDRLGQAVIDSVEGPGETWIRSAGFDEAWASVGERPVALL